MFGIGPSELLIIAGMLCVLVLPILIIVAVVIAINKRQRRD
jgi:Mn2+/Fe2+ NRAMP family transporter